LLSIRGGGGSSDSAGSYWYLLFCKIGASAADTKKSKELTELMEQHRMQLNLLSEKYRQSIVSMKQQSNKRKLLTSSTDEDNTAELI
jgi:hypothetical protein